MRAFDGMRDPEWVEGGGGCAREGETYIQGVGANARVRGKGQRRRS